MYAGRTISCEKIKTNGDKTDGSLCTSDISTGTLLREKHGFGSLSDNLESNTSDISTGTL
jgi:hypothetical protein